MDSHLKTTGPKTPVIRFRGIPQSDITDNIRERVLKTRRNNRVVELN